MISLGLELLATAWRSTLGKMVLIGFLAWCGGYYQGYRHGDEGRARLAVQYQQETQRLVAAEAAKAKQIQEESDREAAQHELEMAERDRALEEVNREVEGLEKASKCVISKGTVRALNRGR